MRKLPSPATLESVTTTTTPIPPVPTTRRARRRTAPVITTNDPPLLLHEDAYETCAAVGMRVFQVQFPMLLSINRQYGTSSIQTGLHTNKTFGMIKRGSRKIIQEAVKDAGWITDKDDRYIIVFDFSFPNMVKQDIDGPRKATGDILQRMRPTKKQKEKLLTEEALVAWHDKHPFAIWNDGQIFQEIVVKHVNQPKDNLLCVATIYAFHEQAYIPVPLHTLLYTYLLNAATYHAQLTSHTTKGNYSP